MAVRIAIVEDEPAIRANYVDALSRYGHRVVGFASRPEAQQALQDAAQALRKALQP